MANGKVADLKGRVEEAAGVVTGNKKLKRQGQRDPCHHQGQDTSHGVQA